MDVQLETDKSIHLSASAGSGKTRALKDRYLALVEKLDQSGLGLDQAVAITFTDKAAAEIKERVMRGLPEPLLKKIIRGRQDLRISTIHSFCMNLLKRYPLEAGLPPDFGVLDNRDQAHHIRRAVEETLEATDRDDGAMAPLRSLNANELISVIEFLISIRSRLKRMEIDAGGMDGLLAAVRAGTGMEDAQTELRNLIGRPEWRAEFLQMELLLRSQDDFHVACRGTAHGLLSAATDAADASRIAESLAPVYFTLEFKPRTRLPISKTKFRATASCHYAAYETLFQRIQDALSRFYTASSSIRAGREAISLLSLYHRAEAGYQEAKLREGMLDFDDLEIYAYDLLKNADSPDILYWLDRKILHFLVDEFQDTSDIQWAVLNKLTEEIFAGQGTDKPMPPTLFVVGDAKQSIYRFREANYRLIEQIREKMVRNLPPSARVIRTLDRNYRSAKSVIETANRVFTALWGENYHAAEADRKDHEGSVRLIEILAGADEGMATGEADALAREIQQMINGETLIYEKNTEPHGSSAHPAAGGWQKRRAGFGDCAILIQSRTRLKEYEESLRNAGIPFRVVGGIGFYEEDEIQAIMNTLFFLWNRRDTFSLASALASPLLGMSHQNILRLFSGEEDPIAILRNHHPDTWGLLHQWSLDAGVMPLADIINRIVSDSGAYIRFGRHNPQALFNIDKLIDTARQFDRRGYTTLQDFVEWIKNIREAEQREASADLNLPGFVGAVNIMTAHKAKGLEFPIVFLPGMNQQPRSLSTGPIAIIESDGLTRLAVKNAGNPVYDELWEHEQQELRREHQRLLYVAMTRARDHLVMLGTHASGRQPIKRNSWLSFVREAIPSTAPQDAGARVSQYASPDWSTRQWTPAPIAMNDQQPPEPPSRSPIDASTVLANLAPLPPSDAPEWRSATDFISRDREWSLKPPPDSPRNAPSPLTRGSFLHRCLEALASSGAYDVSRLADTFPELTLLDDDARDTFLRDATSVIRKIQSGEELAWIFERGPDRYAELPFLYRQGRDIISGVVDRVVVSGDTARVIDYKAIQPENAEATAYWVDHYRPQIKIYCEAVKEMFGVNIVEGFLLFLDSARLESVYRIS